MRTLSILALLFLAACAGAADQACQLEKRAELSLRVVNNVPVLSVEINGRPASLVLDTGSNTTVLTRTAARRLGVAEGVVTKEIRGAGGALSVGTAQLDTMTIGPIALTRTPVLLADNPGPPLDGLLGIDVMIDYEVELDIPRHRAAFYRARPCPAARPDWAGRIVSLPVQQQAGSGHLFVPTEIDGQPLRGMLDSGASHSTLSLQSAADTGLRRRALESLPSTRSQAVNPGGLVIRQAAFKQLKVGTDILPNPVLTIADLPAFAGDLLVGADYIGTRRLWFSFRTGRVFVSSE